MSKDKGENQPTLYGIPDYDDWSDSNNYKQYDRVNYKGAIYAARVSNSGVNPFFDDGATWELVYGYAFEDNDTMEVENSNGTLISGRKVNASGGIGSNVTSKGLNIWGIKASKDSYGVVKAGDGINIDDGVISSKIATADSVGVVKPDGDTITIDEDGTLVATPAVPTNGWEKIDIDFSSVINGTKLDCYKSSIFILLRLYTSEYFEYSTHGVFISTNSLNDLIKFNNKSTRYTKTIAPIIAVSNSTSSEITGTFEGSKFSISYAIGNNTSSIQAGQTIAEFIFPINTFI